VVRDLEIGSNPTIGAKANTMMVSLSATCVRVKFDQRALRIPGSRLTVTPSTPGAPLLRTTAPNAASMLSGAQIASIRYAVDAGLSRSAIAVTASISCPSRRRASLRPGIGKATVNEQLSSYDRWLGLCEATGHRVGADSVRGHFDQGTLRGQAEGEMTCLLKWEPGATLPMHKHPEIEQTFVIEGSFYDHDGVCREVSLRQRVRAPAREGYNQLPPIGTPTIAFVQRFL
jgi:hypothetical protein